MDFSLSEEQVALRDLARQILEDQLTPDRLREIEGQPDWFDRKVWEDLARANLLGLAVSDKFGGMGYGFLELCLLLEEIGRTVAPLPALPTLVMGALPISEFGSDAQREHYLPRVVAGETVLSAALTEEGVEDPLRPLMQARRDGSGWRLEGSKTCVPAAHLAERVLVPARTEQGVGVFLLDPTNPRVQLERQETTSGEPQFRITVSGAELDGADLLGDPSNGAQILDWLVQRVTAAYAAMQLGVSDRALRMTAHYTSEREQFGRRLSTFQAVAQRAANCYVDVEALRLTVQQAVWSLGDGRDVADEVAIAKYWVGETGHRVSYAAQHLHGGIGVDIDYPLYRYCLWSKQIELSLGSSSHQLERLGSSLAEDRA